MSIFDHLSIDGGGVQVLGDNLQRYQYGNVFLNFKPEARMTWCVIFHACIPEPRRFFERKMEISLELGAP